MKLRRESRTASRRKTEKLRGSIEDLAGVELLREVDMNTITMGNSKSDMDFRWGESLTETDYITKPDTRAFFYQRGNNRKLICFVKRR